MEGQSLAHRVKEHLHALGHSKHKAVARAAIASHFVYYVMVFIEAHGSYGIAAGVCGVILVVEVVLGQDKNG